jgi:hypothetical protein
MKLQKADDVDQTGVGGHRGFPAQAAITPNALDETVAQKLWRLAEGGPGIHFPY